MGMELPDEQRRLGEIERELAADDPRLARRFARRERVSAGTLAAVIAGVAGLAAAGGTLIVAGVRLGLPVVAGIGVIIAVALPVLVWVARR
jgi:hypothetical protein